jgi:DNA-binding NarL/FixJ family response regulator
MSEGEMELLNTGSSVVAIADELVVAVSAVRSHVKSIYAKLGAHGRIEAVHRA